MSFIQTISTWKVMPLAPPLRPYEEVDGLLREMKEVLSSGVRPPCHPSSWWVKRLWECGYQYPLEYGLFLYDSALAVNRFLLQEAREQNTTRTPIPLTEDHFSWYRPDFRNIARLDADCFFLPHGELTSGAYLSRICVSFYRGKDRQETINGFLFGEMAENGWWQHILRDLGLFHREKLRESSPSLNEGKRLSRAQLSEAEFSIIPAGDSMKEEKE